MLPDSAINVHGPGVFSFSIIITTNSSKFCSRCDQNSLLLKTWECCDTDNRRRHTVPFDSIVLCASYMYGFTFFRLILVLHFLSWLGTETFFRKSCLYLVNILFAYEPSLEMFLGVRSKQWSIVLNGHFAVEDIREASKDALWSLLVTSFFLAASEWTCQEPFHV